METDHIDSFFRKSIKESEGYYDAEANLAKARIWGQVQQKEKKRVLPIWTLLLAAACILLFISTSILTLSNFKAHKKIDALVESNTQLQNRVLSISKNKPVENERSVVAALYATDTVYVEKQIVITKPIIQTERITDTVYIQQIVCDEKEPSPGSTMAIENSIETDSIFETMVEGYEKEILIDNAENSGKEKRKKFQLKFGGNQNPGRDGTIALSSKL